MRRLPIQALLILALASVVNAQPYTLDAADVQRVLGTGESLVQIGAALIYLAGVAFGWLVYGEMRRGGGIWDLRRPSSH